MLIVVASESDILGAHDTLVFVYTALHSNPGIYQKMS